MIHVEEERRTSRTLNERGGSATLLSAASARTRAFLALPPLPPDSAERADLLQAMATDIVAWCGPAVGLALAAAIDEATEVEGCAGERD